jgi:nucleotide-binding universal stress UspA family protein
MVLGSVTERVLHESQVPVLIVNSASPELNEQECYRNILVPLDGSTRSEAALTAVQAMRLHKSAKIVLLRSVPPNTPPFTMGMTTPKMHATLDADQRKMEATQYLDGITTRYLYGRRHQAQVVADYPAKAILEAVARHCIDLIVMATHDLRDVDRPGRASVTEHVLHNTCTPVLVVHGMDYAKSASDLKSTWYESSDYDDCLFTGSVRHVVKKT